MSDRPDPLATAAAQLAAAERLTDACRAWRDQLVLREANAGVSHSEIGQRAELSVKGVGKITRNAGLRRYTPRAEPEPDAPKSTVGASADPGS
jgi:hypothetical protein